MLGGASALRAVRGAAAVGGCSGGGAAGAVGEIGAVCVSGIVCGSYSASMIDLCQSCRAPATAAVPLFSEGGDCISSLHE